MGKISKILFGSLAVNSIQAQDFEVTSCDDPNSPVSKYMTSKRRIFVRFVNFLNKTAGLVLSVNQRYR